MYAFGSPLYAPRFHLIGFYLSVGSRGAVKDCPPLYAGSPPPLFWESYPSVLGVLPPLCRESSPSVLGVLPLCVGHTPLGWESSPSVLRVLPLCCFVITVAFFFSWFSPSFIPFPQMKKGTRNQNLPLKEFRKQISFASSVTK